MFSLGLARPVVRRMCTTPPPSYPTLPPRKPLWRSLTKDWMMTTLGCTVLGTFTGLTLSAPPVSDIASWQTMYMDTFLRVWLLTATLPLQVVSLAMFLVRGGSCSLWDAIWIPPKILGKLDAK